MQELTKKRLTRVGYAITLIVLLVAIFTNSYGLILYTTLLKTLVSLITE